MARASIPTLLSLDRYAAIMGINPAHFNGATGTAVMPFTTNACRDLWLQYAWQSADRVSREDLAMAIADAERDIARALGWWPAPMWAVEEVARYPTYHRPDVIQYGTLTPAGYQKSVQTRWGNVIAPGRRAVSDAVAATTAALTLTYTSEDGDLVAETATVAVPVTWTDARETQVFFTGYSGGRAWQIRPARTQVIAAGTFTATFWTWQFILPALWEALTTTAGETAVDPFDDTNLVTEVEVRRVYNDTTQVSAQFYWEPKPQVLRVGAVCTACGGSGCLACQLTTQDGCLHVRDAETGMVVPQVASYDDDDGQWEAACQSECRDPDYVKLWYYAGLIDDDYLSQVAFDPLSNWWAQAVAWLATARLERPFCSCANVTALAQNLRVDLAMMSEDVSFATTEEILGNPFGTKRGEVMAWARVGKMARRRGKMALI